MSTKQHSYPILHLPFVHLHCTLMSTTISNLRTCTYFCAITYLFVLIFFQTSEDFRKRLNDILRGGGFDIDNKRYPEGYQEAPLAYDAVWAVALGGFQFSF